MAWPTTGLPPSATSKIRQRTMQRPIIVSGLKYGEPVGKIFEFKDGQLQKKSNVQKVRGKSGDPIYMQCTSAEELFSWLRNLDATTMLLAGNWPGPEIEYKIIL